MNAQKSTSRINLDETLLFNYQNRLGTRSHSPLAKFSWRFQQIRVDKKKWCYSVFGYSKKLLPAYWAKDFIKPPYIYSF